MTHYNISVYFNPCNYRSRYKLTKEFIERYPNVILIEVAFGDQKFMFSDYKNVLCYREYNPFWVTTKYINKFVKDHIQDLESVTFIDSDITVDDDFFDDIKYVFDNSSGPLFLQPYSIVENDGHFRNGMMYDYKINKIYSQQNHCGLAYSFNLEFIRLVFPLPEKLILGGYDNVLYLCLFKIDRLLYNLYSDIRKQDIIEELLEFRARFNKIKGINYNFLFGTVIEHSHGKKENRGYNSRNFLYRKMNGVNNKSIIMDYFRSRKEDD